jgi:hypothetical protein
MPVLLARRDPDHVTRPDLLDGVTPSLDAARTSRHDQNLAARMRVSRSPGTGLERHRPAACV